MSGKILIQWRHSYCAETAKKRYIGDDPELFRQAHKEIVNLFFPPEEHDDSEGSHMDEKSLKSGKSFFLFNEEDFVIIISLFSHNCATRWRIIHNSTNFIWHGYLIQHSSCRRSLASFNSSK